MNRIQINRTERASTTSAYMAKNNVIWAGNLALTDTMTEVDADLGAVAGLDVKQKTPIDGEAVDKATVQLHVEEKILLVADQVAALAAKNGDAVLEAQADLNLTQLDVLSADDLEATATRIVNLATANLPALAAYKITQADLTELTTLTGTFHTAKTTPRVAVVDRKKQTDSLVPLVKSLKSALQRRLDRQMRVYKKPQPEFYAGYLAARVIVDRGHGPKTKPPTAPATPPTPTPPTP